MSKKQMHELVPFLAVHAERYAREHGLNGLHPTHYDLMEKHGGRMELFKRATNEPVFGNDAFETSPQETRAND